MNAKRLWTGKTAKQELMQGIDVIASAKSLTVADALETALDGAEHSPDGSPKRETLRYWDSLSADMQRRLLGKARTRAKRMDALMGRKIAR